MDATCVRSPDKYLLKAEMSPAQQVNCQADKLATAALMAVVGQMNSSQASFHQKKSALISPRNGIAEEPVMGSPKNAITLKEDADGKIMT